MVVRKETLVGVGNAGRRLKAWYTKRALWVILFCVAAVLLIKGAKVWIRDNVFPPPDPIELRHRIEAAGAWPAMVRIADKRLEGDETAGEDELRKNPLAATRM